jgi:hypothetical protein
MTVQARDDLHRGKKRHTYQKFFDVHFAPALDVLLVIRSSIMHNYEQLISVQLTAEEWFEVLAFFADPPSDKDDTDCPHNHMPGRHEQQVARRKFEGMLLQIMRVANLL